MASSLRKLANNSMFVAPRGQDELENAVETHILDSPDPEVSNLRVEGPDLQEDLGSSVTSSDASVVQPSFEKDAVTLSGEIENSPEVVQEPLAIASKPKRVPPPRRSKKELNKVDSDQATGETASDPKELTAEEKKQ